MHSFFDSTLFVFLGDHGARVYGSDQIPLMSYEIPVLFYSPTLTPNGETCEALGSQMDIAPTILDNLGVDYNSEFFWTFSFVHAKGESAGVDVA